VRTVFNLLGPLCNPLAAPCQVIGVYAPELVDRMAEALVSLGIRRALVVHGEDGLDEITLCAMTQVAEIRDGWIRRYRLDPRRYGFSFCSPEGLAGGDLKDNCGIALDLLDGKRGPMRDVTLLNAAATIMVQRGDIDLCEGLELARNSLDSGAARHKLEQLIGCCRA
jgi:anthranilate phosphoribosyltransferase